VFLYSAETFSQDVMPYFLSVEQQKNRINTEKFQQKVQKSLVHLQKKRVSIQDNKQFLRYVFNYTHQKFLHQYQKTAHFGDMMLKKQYNCVTGTALLAYFMEHSGFVCQIQEAEKHVFIIVQISEKDRLLIESTAFFGDGVIDDEKKIDEKLLDLRPTGTASLMNLAGMQFYNEAVLAFQDQRYLESLSLSNKAYYFYPSEKVKTLYQISKQKLSEQVASR
jgi:hypothetical protein